MAFRENESVGFSLSVSKVEAALGSYAGSPQLGLEALREALIAFNSKLSDECLYYEVISQRLSSMLFSIEHLLASGSPYFDHYHVAFMSACDSIFQIVIANSFSEERVRQLYFLLSPERSCWVVLGSAKEDVQSSPDYIHYEAQFNADVTGQEQSIEAYFTVLATIGRVSFHLDSAQKGLLSGRFKLLSVQKIEWLEMRLPDLTWSVSQGSSEKSFKTVCELSFLSLFQNLSMAKHSRYKSLDLFERQFKSSYYQPFGSLFSSSSIIKDVERLVCFGEESGTFKSDNTLEYFPLRNGGCLYVASKQKSDAAPRFSYVSYLGNDFLSYFLYDVTTPLGRFAFDKSECIGVYELLKSDIYLSEGEYWYRLSSGSEAKIILNVPFTDTEDSYFCIQPYAIKKVLVVCQVGRYLAIPFFSLCEVEAVSCNVHSHYSMLKNVWVDQYGHTLLEPWFSEESAIPKNMLSRKSKELDRLSKGGYYLGHVDGRSILISAELISFLIPYDSSHAVRYFNEYRQEVSFFIYEGECFDSIDFRRGYSGIGGLGEKDYAFSVCLDWMGESVVIFFESCKWLELLPEGYDSDDAQAVPTVWTGSYDRKAAVLPSETFILNKKNYLSFITGFKPSLTLA